MARVEPCTNGHSDKYMLGHNEDGVSVYFCLVCQTENPTKISAQKAKWLIKIMDEEYEKFADS